MKPETLKKTTKHKFKNANDYAIVADKTEPGKTQEMKTDL